MITTARSGYRRARHGFACHLLTSLWLMSLPVLADEQPKAPEAQVDAYLRQQMQKLRIPGMAIAVVKDGHIVLTRHYGVASVEFDQPVRDDTVFAINSITKAFTGVAAMRLVQAGKLDLSAPVSRYLHDLPEAWRAVTIRQLLTHSSGLPDIMRAPTVETDANAAWAWIKQQPIVFPPGKRFHYCQTNYTLIQRVLNTIEGRALDAPLAEEQIRLAGMTQTSYGDAYDVIIGKAPTYRWMLAGPFVNGYSGAPAEAPRTLKAASERFLPFRRASSGLNSTATDLARWLLAVADGRLLDATSRDLLWQPASFSDGKPGQWGLGWEVLARGTHRAVGMTGGGRAAVFFYPDDGVGVAILTNLAGAFPEDMVDKVASLYAPNLPLTGVPALRISLEDQGYQHASEIAAAIEAKNPDMRWSEMELSDWAYRLLSSGRARDSLPIFQLMVDKFPRSADAEDSLAQVYHVLGDTEASIRHYRRELEIDPSIESARRHIEEITRAATK